MVSTVERITGETKGAAMKLLLKSVCLLLSGALSLFTPSALAIKVAGYEFPIENPYDATVLGTPKELSASVPERIPSKVYTIKSIDPPPELFWYQNGLKFSAALQDHPAPLVFNIAGTGAGYNASKLIKMQRELYHAGFHVINISSPTSLNFLISGSTDHMPGYTPDDAQDLYRVMQQAYAMVKEDIQVTAFHVAGYSLGALHAAFVADIDQREKKFNLQKVFMINPPVSVYNSAIILDKLGNDNIPKVNGVLVAGKLLDEVIDALAQAYEPDKGMEFDNDFIYSAYGQKVADGTLNAKRTSAALIGLSFRMTSGAMVFASDVMTKTGYFVTKDQVFASNDSLIPYIRASFLITFQEYIENMLVPRLQKKYPDKNRATILQDASLHAIEDFLKSNPNIRVIVNRDEIILAPGELDYLEAIMGNRITVYPLGGHCGNMNHKTNVASMVSFLNGVEAP